MAVLVVALLVYGRFGFSVWPFWSIVWPFSLWPFWFVAVLDVILPQLYIREVKVDNKLYIREVKVDNKHIQIGKFCP